MSRTCPLCNSTDNLNIETNNVFGDSSNIRAFYHCGNCDVFFQWPRLTKEEEEEFYRNEFEKFMTSRSNNEDIDWSSPEKHIKSNEDQRKRREEYLNSYYEKFKNGKLLEIGCSSGFMLYGIEEKYNISTIGIEPSGVFSDFLKYKKIPVYNSIEELAKKSPNDKYDIITSYFVLEHIQSPKEFLLKSYELLNDGGVIIFEVPNANDPLRTIFKTQEFKDFYWSIAHPWYFTEKSLSFLLKDMCGFDKVSIFGDQRYDLGNHSQWMLDGKPGGQGKLDSVFDERFVQEYRRCLIESKKCDTLILVVQKLSQ